MWYTHHGRVTTDGEEQRATAPGRRWLWLLTGGVVGLGAYYAAPLLGVGATAQNVFYLVLGFVGMGATVAGVLRHRPERPLPWLLLAAGLASFTVGDVIWFVNHDLRDSAAFPDTSDVFYLAQYPFYGAALFVLVRRRTPDRHAATVIDAAVVTVSAGLLWWVYLLAPIAADPEFTVLARLISMAYPLGDLLVLTLLLRLLLGAGARSTALALVATALASFLVADVAFAYLSAADAYRDGSWVDAGWLVAYFLVGAATLHPSMTRTDRIDAAAGPPATPVRLTVLAAASLVAPAVLIAQHVRGADPHVPVAATVCAVLFLLVLGRMGVLIVEQRRLAVTDALTGTYTRGYFEERLRVECGRAVRGDGGLGVIVVDADHFKTINDTHGHPAGDRVLVELARRLAAGCRPGDVVARYGGEEFALLLPGAGPGQTARIAERIRQSVAADPVDTDAELRLDVTVSVGCATLPGDGDRADDLVKAADRALYAAKAAGRNRAFASDGEIPPAAYAAAIWLPDEVPTARLRGGRHRRADQRRVADMATPAPPGAAPAGSAAAAAPSAGSTSRPAAQAGLAAQIGLAAQTGPTERQVAALPARLGR
jgi:diguanylate cyclase (GGDEF)-like protein